MFNSYSQFVTVLILKSFHWSCSLEKGVFKKITGKHLYWSLFLIKLQAWGSATQMFSTEICKIFKSTYLFLRATVSSFTVSLFTVHEKETPNEV